ncbi:peptidyl-prolyl cis-trans isomerase [Bacteroidota bacterium]
MFNKTQTEKDRSENKNTAQSVFNRIVRKPLFHFLLIGSITYVLYGFFSEKLAESAESDRTITVTQAEIAFMEDSWQKRWNRPPTKEEKDGFINAYIKEMVFYRVALEMGLDKNDVTIRRLLGQKLQFITNDLIQPQQPGEDELKVYFKNNIDKYTAPETVTMTQIFFDPDLRDDKTLTDAEKALGILNNIDIESVNVNDYGDQIMLQNYYPHRTEAEIARQFGTEFAKTIIELKANEWHGPILSGYGTHIVYIHSRQEPDPPAFDEVREFVLENWVDEKKKELNDLYYQGLVSRYDVVIEDSGLDDANNN